MFRCRRGARNLRLLCGRWPWPTIRGHVPTPPIAKVWIEAGCISCQLCQDIAPEVFLVENGQDCVVRPDAARHFAARQEEIEQAARDCPVEVIRLDRR